jgi:hypothetical protein
MTASPEEDRADDRSAPGRGLGTAGDRGRLERFLSRSFGAPYGPHVDPDGVRGYPVDFRAKAIDLEIWPVYLDHPGTELWVALTQRGLGCYERWLGGDGDDWLNAARATADLLVREQREDGSWVHTFEYPHTFALSPPWTSGMSQGQGASLLVRVHAETGEERYAEAALRALEPLYVDASEGGAAALLDGVLVPEEYPTKPRSLVLNGLIFGLWGLRDVAVATGDERALAAFDGGIDALVRSIDEWDTGRWSRYDLYPHRVINLASPAYHALHITQLNAMGRLTDRPELVAVAWRWAEYAERRANRAIAFARKAAFRFAEPRSPRMRGLAPWVHGGAQ